jgi:hypothetical protein
MNIAANHVLLAFQNWEERKKELAPLLQAGFTDERTIAGLQLDHLRQARHRLNNSARPDEKPFMGLLNNHIDKLEKQLYPNLPLRLFSQFKDRLINGPAYSRGQAQQRTVNMDNLKIQLQNAGLSGIAGKLEKHLDAEEQSVCLPLDCQLGPDKRLNYDLHFEKDAYGAFQFHRLSGNLLENGKIMRSQEFELSEWPDLKSHHVWGLLEGRAVRQEYTNLSGHRDQRWAELGPNGLQYYDRQYPFDLREELRKLPITRNQEEMIRYLEGGQLVSSYWKKDGQFQPIYVQADPANQTVKLFDAKQKPITAEQLNQVAQKQGTMKKLEVPAQRMRKGVKNGHRY